jgi:RNA polymerase nonessential primary-like sigma factor
MAPMSLDPDSPLARYVERQPRTDPEVFAGLVASAQAGDAAARDELMQRALPLITAYARRWQARWTLRSSVDLDDLVSWGIIGLDRAIELYDPSRGARFTTFARNHVLAHIARAFEKSAFLIRPPANALSQRRKMHRVISVETVIGHGNRYDDLTLGETLSGETPDHLGDLAKLDEAEGVHELVASLPRRERDVVRLRMGFGDHPGDERQPMTWAEVSAIHRISAQRAQQIYNRAVSRMRRRMPAVKK